MSAYQLFQLSVVLKRVEEPDDWLLNGNPREKARLEYVLPVSCFICLLF